MTPVKPGNIGELVCTVDGVIAESNRLLKAGDVVSPDLFKFVDGLEAPKAGDTIESGRYDALSKESVPLCLFQN